MAVALVKSLLYVLCFEGCQFLVGVGFSAGAAIAVVGKYGGLDWDVYYQTILNLTSEMTLISGVVTLGVVFLIYALRERSPRQEFSLHPVDGRQCLTAVGIALVLYWAVTVLFAFVPEEWLYSYVEASNIEEDSWLMLALSTAVVAPVVEEVIWRGLMLSRLNRAAPGWPAVLISSLCFGVLHGHPLWIIYASALGVVFALMTLRTGSIIPSIITHAVFNSIDVILSLFIESETALITAHMVVLGLAIGAGILLRRHIAAMMDCRQLSRCAYGWVPAPDAARDTPLPEGQWMTWDEDSGAGHRFPIHKL